MARLAVLPKSWLRSAMIFPTPILQCAGCCWSRSQQIDEAVALRPDLVTLSTGGNDVVFHGSDPDKLADKL